MKKSKPIADALRKLDRPPAGPNWVRFVRDTPQSTGRAIASFALGMPKQNYLSGSRAIKDKIELGISNEAVLKAAGLGGFPSGRQSNIDLAAAFLKYDAARGYSSANPIGFDPGYFRVSRDIIVPVSPLSVIREKGRFVPIFLCGWAKNPLTRTQRRLLMTLYEDGFLSLTDYIDAPAEVLFFPKEEQEDRVKRREAEVWLRGDYDLLSDDELRECLQIFSEGREIARSLLEAKAEEKRPEESSAATTAPLADLFSER